MKLPKVILAMIISTATILLFSCQTTVLKKIPAGGMLNYGEIVYVENDGRCDDGEVIRVKGGSYKMGFQREYRCVDNPNKSVASTWDAKKHDMASIKIADSPKSNIIENKPVSNLPQVNKHISVESKVFDKVPETGIENPDAIAVVIGNKDYKNNDIPTVDYAINDAEAVKQYLEKALGYKDGNIIYEPNATKATFEALFGIKDDHRGKLYNWVKKGKSDIFVYYSGHGAPDTRSKQGYFVPSDADPQVIRMTGYPLNQLYDNLSKIVNEMDIPNVYIVIDACFSGGSEKGLLLKNASPITIEVTSSAMKMKNTVVLTSSSGAEISSWYPEKSHSMFTYFLLESLKKNIESGKKTITANDLYSYVSDKTEGIPYYARRLHGRIQTPTISGDKDRVLFNIE